MQSDSVELRLRRNAPRVALQLLAVAAAAEVARHLLAVLREHVSARIAIALVQGIRNWCVVMAMFAGVLWGMAVLTGALNRRFPSVQRRTSTIVLVGVLSLLVLACLFFVPFCSGSLEDGTYDCITLARRAQSALRGS